MHYHFLVQCFELKHQIESKPIGLFSISVVTFFHFFKLRIKLYFGFHNIIKTKMAVKNYQIFKLLFMLAIGLKFAYPCIFRPHNKTKASEYLICLKLITFSFMIVLSFLDRIKLIFSQFNLNPFAVDLLRALIVLFLLYYYFSREDNVTQLFLKSKQAYIFILIKDLIPLCFYQTSY